MLLRISKGGKKEGFSKISFFFFFFLWVFCCCIFSAWGWGRRISKERGCQVGAGSFFEKMRRRRRRRRRREREKKKRKRKWEAGQSGFFSPMHIQRRPRVQKGKKGGGKIIIQVTKRNDHSFLSFLSFFFLPLL